MQKSHLVRDTMASLIALGMTGTAMTLIGAGPAMANQIHVNVVNMDSKELIVDVDDENSGGQPALDHVRMAAGDRKQITLETYDNGKGGFVIWLVKSQSDGRCKRSEQWFLRDGDEIHVTADDSREC